MARIFRPVGDGDGYGYGYGTVSAAHRRRA
jgi:hypothetical protein